MSNRQGQRPPGPMRDSGDASPAPNSMILWLAFVVAVLIYGVVGFVVPVSSEAARLPGWIFPVIALILGISALLLPTFLSGRGQATTVTGGIIAWAMDESVAVVGLVSVFLGASSTVFVAYLVGSWVLLWIHRPRG